MGKEDTKARPLLFINSDATNPDTVDQRRAIYQHVQLKYAKWKRLDDARKMRASVKTPSFASSAGEPASSTSRSPVCVMIESEKDKDPPPSTTNQRTRPNIGKPRDSLRAQLNPLNSPGHGNSDPFNALAVKVSPKINALMQYSRDYYLPGIQRDVNDPGSRIVAPEWTQCMSFLRDEGLAYSHFARIAAVIASDPKQTQVTADFQTQAMVFKSKSMAVLRKRLEQCPEDSKTYNQILLLLNAELYGRNFEAASSHARILATLLQNGTIKAHHTFLFKVVYHDTQRAAMSLTRPSFDLEGWVPLQLAPVVNAVMVRIPYIVTLEGAAQDLDPILDLDFPLKKALTGFKHACLCLLLVIKNPSLASDGQLVYHGRFQTTLAMGRFINLYLDATSLLFGNAESTNAWTIDHDSSTLARVRCFASLAFLLLLRCLTRIDNVKISGNIAIFSANALIVQRLKEALRSSERYCLVEMHGKFANIRLYALFVGAWLEQAKAAASSAGSHVHETTSVAGQGWFNSELAEQARAMGLKDWPDVRKILSGFVYTDLLAPNGSTWFPQIMNAGDSIDPSQM